MSPEQNFGLLAMRPGLPDKHHEIDGLGNDFPVPPTLQQNSQINDPLDGHDPMRSLRALTVDHDEGFLHLLLQVESLDPDANGQVDWDKVDYLIGLDTLDPNRGDSCLDVTCTIRTERRIEFLLRIDSADQVTLSVDQPYDLVGVWHGYRADGQLYRPATNDDGLFNLMRTVTNDEFWFAGQKIAPIIHQDVGAFRTGPETKTTNTNFWYSLEQGTLEIRIPWTLLNVTDPSSRMVVDDDVPGMKDAFTELKIHQTPGFAVVVAALGGAGEAEETLVDTIPRAIKQGPAWFIASAGTPTYTWATWDANPNYRMYRKQSFGLVQSALPGIVPESAQVKP
jgi:hypothetical protein